MAKVILSIEKKKDIFLHKSSIENLFISEYLPDAPGDYVKVYILGSMYAQFDEDMDSRKLAISLGLSEDEIEEAWIYWASRGAIRRRKELTEDGEEIERIDFLSLIGQLYGRAAEEPADVDVVAVSDAEEAAEDPGEDLYVSLDDPEYDDEEPAVRLTDTRLREIYRKYQEVTGRTVSRQETSKIADAIKVYGIKPEIFDFAIDYCADLEKYSIDYIFKVALRWTEEGCETVEDAKRLLDKHSLRNSYYSQVFKSLGFNRLAAPADREIMDRWFDEMGCTIAEVLDACRASAGLREPNLRYVNKVLENRRLEAGGVNTRLESSNATGGNQSGDKSSQDGGSMVSRKVLNDYFEYIRNEGEAEQDARVAEVRAKIPEMEEIFEAESRMNQRLLSIRPGADASDARNELRAQRAALEKRRKDLLDANGYPEDYLSRRYRCSICRDTGYTDEGMVCSCCRERAEEAYKWIGNNKQ
jgi:DnaD/phage-associated family protein